MMYEADTERTCPDVQWMRLSLSAEVTFVLAIQLGSEEKLQTMSRFSRKPPGAVLCIQAQIWTPPRPPQGSRAH